MINISLLSASMKMEMLLIRVLLLWTILVGFSDGELWTNYETSLLERQKRQRKCTF